MNTINLKFAEVIETMAKERGLTISEIKGKLSFAGNDVNDLKLSFYVDGCDHIEEIEAYDELYLEKDIAAALDRCKLYIEGFKVTRLLYEDVARHHLESSQSFKKTIDGGVQVYVEFDKLNTWMDTGVRTSEGCLGVKNDFDAYDFMTVYEEVRDRLDDENRIRRHSEDMLRRIA